ncbi:serine hydrolase domain-containing protein [Rathayibacter oskolensis]|nr:serine hydrolase domain-containing protein [Rathayibacter oskolensis]
MTSEARMPDPRTPAAGATPTLPPALVDALVQRLASSPPTAPSTTFALFDREGVLLHHSIGEHGTDGRPPALGTVYRIASMSKSVEAAAVLVLRDRGLLDLDDLVSAHVPEFADPVDDGSVVPVTLRMLLTNCSGLPEDNGWADHVMGMTRDEFLAVVARGLAFTERPGGVYQYSNIGFWLLGVVVENLTGQTFAEFATCALLEPLGLDDTRYAVSDYDDDDDVARGFSTYDEGATWVERPVVASGAGACAASLFSTVTDIARWSAWLSSAFDPAESGDAVLSRASRREMQRGATIMPSITDRSAEGRAEGTAYGMGLVLEQDVRFGAIAQHSGGLPGWSSNMRWHLASGIGVVVFANADGAKLGPTAAALLRAALEEFEPPAREIVLLPSTVEAARAIEAAIASGDLTDASALFSPNLLSDVPAEVRARRLAAAIAEVGGLADEPRPLADRLLWSASAAQLSFAVPGREGELECRFEMTPTTPALVQRLVIVKREPTTPLSPVTRSYRPRLP